MCVNTSIFCVNKRIFVFCKSKKFFWVPLFTGLDYWTDLFATKNQFYALYLDSLSCSVAHCLETQLYTTQMEPFPAKYVKSLVSVLYLL